MAVPAESLGGLRVLVTRPAPQATTLCRLVEDAGGTALCLPTIVIAEAADPAAAGRLLVEPADIVIFISRNAVASAAQIVPDLSVRLHGRQVLATGEGTRLELADHGIVHALAPSAGPGGGGLLQLDVLGARAVSGRDVLIVRGDGGREQLREELERRGARVRYAEVYSRRNPDAAQLNGMWRAARPDIIVTTSNQGLENLVELVDEGLLGELFATPLVVTSVRARALAAELGFRGRIAAAAAGDDATLLRALVNLAEDMRGR